MLASLKLDPKVFLFIQILVVIGLPLLLWRPLRLGKIFPLPIIQIFAGIALGPSIFGAVAPDLFTFLFRPQVLAGVDTLSNIAAVLFVFLAGCEADKQIIRNAAGTVLRVGTTGVFLPWILGALAAWAIVVYFPVTGLLGNAGYPALYSVSFGLCMAVTALPVLVVLLRELGFNQKPIGSIALAVGGVDDALLWLSLAVLLPFAAGSDQFLIHFAEAVAGGLAVFVIVSYLITPLLDKLIREEAPERLLMSAVILVLFFSSAITEQTGLHAVFGAFLTGLLLPEKLRHMAQSKFDVPVNLLLLPFFFLATGLKTKFGFGDPTVWIVVAIALVTCVGGKFIGVTLPAFLSGQSGPFSITLGILMQCKGLMEIVVVTVLYQKGIFGEVTFSALVLTALVSTALTVPLAQLSQRAFGESATQTREKEVLAVEVAPAVPPVAPAAEPAKPVPAGPVLVFDHDIGVVPIPKSEVVIGRHSEDDIKVNDVRVSRRHAKLKALDDGSYEIINQTADRSEPNPVLVNGEEKEHAVLKDGDVVTLGGLNFTFKKAA